MAKKKTTRTATVQPRPTDDEIAERLRGTRGRCFARQGNVWRDVVTGAVGTPDELEQAWLSEVAQ